MCILSEWPRADIINLAIAIGTVAAAILTGLLYAVARSGFKKLLNQEASKEQLQLMLKFIRDLAQERIPVIDFYRSNDQFLKTVYNKSILEYTSKDLTPIFQAYDMFSENGHRSVAYQYLRNPLMPASIVRKIKNLRDLPMVEFRFDGEELKNNFWLLQDYVPIGRLKQQPMKKYSAGIMSFVEACLELKLSVTFWFYNKGITELNSEFIK